MGKSIFKRVAVAAGLLAALTARGNDSTAELATRLWVVQTMACDYASGSSACHARPWELDGSDGFWLVNLPLLIVLALVAGGAFLRRKRD